MDNFDRNFILIATMAFSMLLTIKFGGEGRLVETILFGLIWIIVTLILSVIVIKHDASRGGCENE